MDLQKQKINIAIGINILLVILAIMYEVVYNNRNAAIIYGVAAVVMAFSGYHRMINRKQSK